MTLNCCIHKCFGLKLTAVGKREPYETMIKSLFLNRLSAEFSGKLFQDFLDGGDVAAEIGKLGDQRSKAVVSPVSLEELVLSECFPDLVKPCGFLRGQDVQQFLEFEEVALGSLGKGLSLAFKM